MTSDHHAPYVQGFTHATMAGTTRCDTVTWGGSLKTGLSSDRSLQLDCVKAESLVIADRNAAVNAFPGLVHTARQVMKVGSTRSRWPDPCGGEPSKVRLVIGTKS